jgi:hypothetical protein
MNISKIRVRKQIQQSKTQLLTTMRFAIVVMVINNAGGSLLRNKPMVTNQNKTIIRTSHAGE